MATVAGSQRQLTHTSNTYESNGDVTVGGNLNINGTTTTIDTANLLVEDKNIIIGDVASPTNTTADGGGITLKGATDKTINWVNSTSSWTSNQTFSAPNLTLTSLSNQSSEATALVVNGSNAVGYRELGSNAFNSTTIPTNNNQLTNGASYITGNQTITLSGDVSGSGTTSISVTVSDDSHNHVISNVDGLQSALDGKATAGDENIIDGATSIWNADGDGDVFNYNDSNPTHNGKYVGAVINIHGDGSADSSLVRAGLFTSNLMSTLNGYYVGALLGNANSTTTQVINGSGVWTGGVIPAAKLSTATTQSSSENSTKIATTAYVKSQGYVTSSGNTIIGTDSDINTSGATVVDQLNMTDGVIQSHSTRTLTLANLGYTGATNANNYSLPAASSSTRGGVKIGYSENGKNYPVEVSSEQMFVNVPWTDTNTTYSVGDGGLTQKNFTSTLKTKLDGIETGATADQTAAEILTLIKTVDGSGSGLDADLIDGKSTSDLYRREGQVDGAVASGGWVTVASNTSSRKHGEVIVSDSDSGDHAFIRIDWMRSYADSNFSVLQVGGHANRITGVRVLYQTSDNTYGTKLLQVYVTTGSTYGVRINTLGSPRGFGSHTVVTPVIENTKSGYALHGNALEGLQEVTLAAEEGIKTGGVVYASGGNSSNWNTAYGWGNHASAGYVTTDTNTTYSAGTGISLSGTTFSLTDTNSKLNLSGGTLTGGLSGTTASFSGNVGIGTTSPSEKLHVDGDGVIFELGGELGLDVDMMSYNYRFGDIDGGEYQTYLEVDSAYGKAIFNNANVGIGTTSPSTKLQISSTMSSTPTSNIFLDVDGSNINGGGGSIIFGTSATAGTASAYNAKITGTREGGGTGGDSRLGFWTTLVSSSTAPQERMTITKEGNVGIGTTSPLGKLHVYQSDNTKDAIVLRGGGQSGSVQGKCSLSMSNFTSETNPAVRITVQEQDASDYRSNLMFLVRSSNSDVAPTERMRIRYDGNVGIGTTNPAQKATISGPNTSPSLNSTTASSATLHLANSDTGYGTYFASLSSGVGLIQQRRQTSNVKYSLALNPYGGNVGIGTTSPSAKLDVEGPIAQKVYTASTLPSASPAGQRAFISDSAYGLATAIGSVVSGGGGNTIPVYSDGSSWRAG